MKNKGSFANFIEVLGHIRFSMTRFIKYQLIAKIIIALMLLPSVQWVMTFLMKKSGFSYITNSELLKFGLSFSGITGIVLILFSLILVMLIQLGGLILLCHQAYLREKESSFLEIFKFLIMRLKNFIGVGLILLLIILLVMAPYMEVDIELFSFKLPGFIKDFIVNNFYLNILLKSLTVVGIMLATLCVFCLHIIILEGENTRTAVKKSFMLVTKNFKAFVKELLLSIVLIVISIVSFIAIYLLLGVGVYFVCSDDVKLFAGIIMFIIFLLLAFIMDIIVFPVILMILTKGYYKLNGQVPVIYLKTKKGGKFKRILAGFVFMIFLLGTFGKYMILDNIGPLTNEIKTKVTAHRGSSIKAPENTLSALKLAINHGADYVELDAQETKDGAIVITHDSNLKRTAGVDNNLWDMTLEDVKKLEVGSYFSEKFKGEQIPTLEEFIDTAKDKIKLNIEIKKHGHEKSLVSSVVKIIEDKNFVDKCVVTSLDYDVIQEVKRLNPKIKTGYITYVAIGDVEKLNLDFYSVEETNINEAFVERAHKANREVHAWTINNEDDIQKMIDLNVDNIITDNDELAISKVKESLSFNDEVSKFLNEIFGEE